MKSLSSFVFAKNSAAAALSILKSISSRTIPSKYLITATGFSLLEEGDKTSIDEKIKILKKKLNLNEFDFSILDTYQSEPFWTKITNLELFKKTQNNILRIVIPPSNGPNVVKYIENKYKYYIDWCGSLFWIELQIKKEEKIKELKKLVKDYGGYLTIVKTSSNYDYGEPIFTIDKIRLMISEKVKKSFDPKRILNPGKMYRGV